jgi:Tfp pilus assembly protein PilN
MRLAQQGTRIGITIGTTALTAVARRGDAARVISVPLLYENDDIVSALPAALENVRARIEAELGAVSIGAAAHVALLPPLAETRLLALPPLRKAEAEAVVRRDAGRYFVGVPAPRIVAVRLPPRTAASAPVQASAAGAVFVEAVRVAVAGAGWRVFSVVPAHAAWLAAAAGRDAPDALIAIDGDTAHVVRITQGAAVSLRRLPVVASAELVQALTEMQVPTGRRIAIFGDAAARDGVARVMTAAGYTPAGLNVSAAEAAARYAERAAMPLVPLTMLAERRDQEKRVAVRLAIAAAVMIIATAALELWGANRQLDAVRGRRADIRADVAPLLMLRDSIDHLDAGMAQLDALARTTPRWTRALFDIALLLPPEAYLTRLYATGDTLVIDAEGARAGTALQALRGSGALRDARLLGAIERELADGSTTVERFRLTARLAGANPDVLARADSARNTAVRR